MALKGIAVVVAPFYAIIGLLVGRFAVVMLLILSKLDTVFYSVITAIDTTFQRPSNGRIGTVNSDVTDVTTG